MESFPDINRQKKYFLDIEIHSYLRDHRIEGRTVLPAVETMIVLARVVKTNDPQMQIRYLQKASFQRFLPISPDLTHQPVIIKIESSDDAVITASLWSLLKSKTGNISREIEHAQVSFVNIDQMSLSAPVVPHDFNHSKKNCIRVSPESVYQDLIPFGKAYQNIVSDLSVSPEGAWASLSGGDNEADENVLGSPFPLDAVLHAACVWGQRYAGILSFPVGFEKRIIFQKTEKKETYQGYVVPVNISRDVLVFDAWIYKNDVICESISGIKMTDVTRGRMHPPAWIVNSNDTR